MLQNEHLVELAGAAKLFPHRPHTATLWRWARKGCAGERLEYIRAGRRILTSVEAVERFCAALTARDTLQPARAAAPEPVAPVTPRGRTAAQRQRDIERAERELSTAGV